MGKFIFADCMETVPGEFLYFTEAHTRNMAQTPALLLVDDDITLSPLVKEYLEGKGMSCTWCQNAFDALRHFNQHPVDLCLLDVQMPMKNGFELAREMKAFKPETPFLFLTGQGEKEDRIRGFEQGAEDYIIKPFSMQELVLRIHVILRRIMPKENAGSGNTPIQFRQYTFYPDLRELHLATDIQPLSEIESGLLTMFLQAPGHVIYREAALKQLWKDEHLFRDKSLNVFVSRLRHILKGDPGIEIQNIHGTGYRMIMR